MSFSHKIITQELLEGAQTYAAYRQMLDDLIADGKTTGTNQSDDLVHYANLNIARMRKWEKTLKLESELVALLQNLPHKEIWLVITEGWCGDAAQCIPPLAKMEEATDKIELKLVLRDENLELMDEYLTNGGRSIPKLIRLNAETGEELGTWGPRPRPVQEMLEIYKKNAGEKTFAVFAEELHAWYAKDKQKHLQAEFINLLSIGVPA